MIGHTYWTQYCCATEGWVGVFWLERKQGGNFLGKLMNVLDHTKRERSWLYLAIAWGSNNIDTSDQVGGHIYIPWSSTHRCSPTTIPKDFMVHHIVLRCSITRQHTLSGPNEVRPMTPCRCFFAADRKRKNHILTILRMSGLVLWAHTPPACPPSGSLRKIAKGTPGTFSFGITATYRGLQVGWALCKMQGLSL